MGPRKNSVDVPHQIGTFLVASPYVTHTHLAKTVVLLLKTGNEGSLGLVLDDAFCRVLKNAGGQLNAILQRQVGALQIPASARVNMMAWQPGKLEKECRQGVWFLEPASAEALFSSEPIWGELVRRVGRRVLRESLHVDVRGVDPILN